MEKVIKVISDGIVQCTVADERFYFDKEGVPLPSVTWITSMWPKGKAFYQWLAEKGWSEAEEIKMAAGDRGSRVHLACADIAEGKQVKITDKYISRITGQAEDLTVEECDCILSFQHFLEQMNPKIYFVEKVVLDHEDGFAGTMDMVCEISGELGILDIKTSQSIWMAYQLQLPAYKRAFKGIKQAKVVGGETLNVLRPITKLWILQVGYRRNKDKWKLTEIDDRYDLFLLAKGIWAEDNAKVGPKMYEFPEVFTWNGHQDNAGRAENTHRKVRPRKEAAPEEGEGV
jgi:hypothetical protein